MPMQVLWKLLEKHKLSFLKINKPVTHGISNGIKSWDTVYNKFFSLLFLGT